MSKMDSQKNTIRDGLMPAELERDGEKVRPSDTNTDRENETGHRNWCTQIQDRDQYIDRDWI